MNWTRDWPTEPGFYWFYGWDFGRREEEPPKIHLVKVMKVANGVLHVGDGRSWWESDGTDGLWAPATLPEPPSLD